MLSMTQNDKNADLSQSKCMYETDPASVHWPAYCVKWHLNVYYGQGSTCCSQ